MATLEDEVQELAPSFRFTLQYSGPESAVFWDAVRRGDDMRLYVLGCALQDLEGRVLREVNTDVENQLRAHLRQKRADKRAGRRGKKQTVKPVVSTRAQNSL